MASVALFHGHDGPQRQPRRGLSGARVSKKMLRAREELTPSQLRDLKAVIAYEKDILELRLSDRADLRAAGYVKRSQSGSSYVTTAGKEAVRGRGLSGTNGGYKTASGKAVPLAPKPDSFYATWDSKDHADAATFFGKRRDEDDPLEVHSYNMRNFHNSLLLATLSEETGQSGYVGRKDADKFRRRARKQLRNTGLSGHGGKRFAKSCCPKGKWDSKNKRCKAPAKKCCTREGQRTKRC